MELDVINTLIDRKVDAAVQSPQPYRTEALGSRPTDPATARRWDTAASEIERYRVGTLGASPDAGPISPGTSGVPNAIGARPTQPAAQAQWDKAQQHAAAIIKPPQAQSAAIIPGPRIGR